MSPSLTVRICSFAFDAEIKNGRTILWFPLNRRSGENPASGMQRRVRGSVLRRSQLVTCKMGMRHSSLGIKYEPLWRK